MRRGWRRGATWTSSSRPRAGRRGARRRSPGRCSTPVRLHDARADRLMMRKGGHPTDTSRDHDFTDWEAVERFARECAGALRRRRVTSGAAGLLVRSSVSLAERRLTGTEGLALCPHLRGTEGLALCPHLRGTEGLALCPHHRKPRHRAESRACGTEGDGGPGPLSPPARDGGPGPPTPATAMPRARLPSSRTSETSPSASAGGPENAAETPTARTPRRTWSMKPSPQ